MTVAFTISHVLLGNADAYNHVMIYCDANAVIAVVLPTSLVL